MYKAEMVQEIETLRSQIQDLKQKNDELSKGLKELTDFAEEEIYIKSSKLLSLVKMFKLYFNANQRSLTRHNVVYSFQKIEDYIKSLRKEDEGGKKE